MFFFTPSILEKIFRISSKYLLLPFIYCDHLILFNMTQEPSWMCFTTASILTHQGSIREGSHLFMVLIEQKADDKSGPSICPGRKLGLKPILVFDFQSGHQKKCNK